MQVDRHWDSNEDFIVSPFGTSYIGGLVPKVASVNRDERNLAMIRHGSEGLSGWQWESLI